MASHRAASSQRSAGEGRVVKRCYTNVEPGAGERGSKLISATSTAGARGEMAAPLPIAKRVRDGPLPPMLPGDDMLLSATGLQQPFPQLRRQLTPRISWSSVLLENSQDEHLSVEGSPPSDASANVLSSPTEGRMQLERCLTPPCLFSPRARGRTTAQPSSPPPVFRSSSSQIIGSPPARPSKPRNWISGATPCRGNLPETEPFEESTDRFSQEFDGTRVVGSGNFAVVYRARNRVDQQEYAIKKTKQPLARGSLRRREMLQEALALASVAIESPSPYIVRYFASWIEDERLFIQTELCDGSLKDFMVSLRRTRPQDPRINAEELAPIVRDVCMGLSVLHSKNLVHLDVKPENVLVKEILPTPSRQGMPSKIHKIADLGLATAAIGSGCDEISEGDSRYLAREVLRGDFSNLTKADVFSLGLLCYELATNPKELPCNGDEWHTLREGLIEEQLLCQLPHSMIALMRRMLRPLALERPPCTEVLIDPAVIDRNSVEELRQQLRDKTEVAELEMKKRATAEEKADRYFSELLHMKRQDLLRDTRDSIPDGLPRVLQPPCGQQPSKLGRSMTA